VNFPGINDNVNLLSKITPRRLNNLLKLYVSCYYSRYSGRVKHSGKPYTVSIEPTTSCNLRCPQCPSGLRSFTRPAGKMNMDLYKKVIDELSPQLFYLILYFQGEPYLNPLFFKMAEYASGKRIYTATSTNAHYLNEQFAEKTVLSGLDRIIISLDGTDQETYMKYRMGGQIEKVIEGTRNLVRIKKELKSKKPYIILQFIAFRSNEHQLDEIRKLAKELKVDKLDIKTAQIYNYENDTEWIPDNEDFSRYNKDSGGLFRINNPLNNHCFRMWRGSVITWDGLVVPCCFDKDAEHRFGDLKNNSFNEVWEGQAYTDFRNKLFTSRKDIEICRNCTEK